MFGESLLFRLASAAVSLILVMLLFWGWGKWQYHEGVVSVKEKIKIETKYIKVESPKVTERVVTEYVDRVKVIHEKGNEIIKKVPVYVTKEDDAKCSVNTGFVQLWNDANQMRVPDSTSTTNETASSVVLTDVAAQHAKEAALYYKTAEQLTALQNWVSAQQKIYSTGAKNGR